MGIWVCKEHAQQTPFIRKVSIELYVLSQNAIERTGTIKKDLLRRSLGRTLCLCSLIPTADVFSKLPLKVGNGNGNCLIMMMSYYFYPPGYNRLLQYSTWAVFVGVMRCLNVNRLFKTLKWFVGKG